MDISYIKVKKPYRDTNTIGLFSDNIRMQISLEKSAYNFTNLFSQMKVINPK